MKTVRRTFFLTQQPLCPFSGCSPGSPLGDPPLANSFHMISQKLTTSRPIRHNFLEFCFLFELVGKGKSPLSPSGLEPGAYKGPKRRKSWPRSGPAQSPRSGDGEEVNTDDKMRPSGSDGRTSGSPRTHQIFQPINTLYVKPVYLGFSMATKATRNQKNLDQ